jgi:threonylcarbamoyladenosine tRNA methylthiotransferase MtaB
MKFRVISLGCRLNQSEIQSVSTALQDMGHELVQNDDADVVIINSCAVTQRSERKTRQVIYRAAGTSPGAPPRKIIVTGCVPGGLAREGNIYHVPNDYKHLIPEIIVRWEDFGSPAPSPGARFSFAPPVKSSTSRVYLKIQDGCDNRCSYCIVPLARGASQSKPADRVADELARLVDAGYREIVLTGVMIGNYRDGGADLAALAARLLSAGGLYRLHLTSISPVSVTPALIELLGHEKIVRHLHLSLQSGSDRVLEAMNRPYTRAAYLALVDRIRSRIPDFNFTTDVIVGFPGETEADFEDTLGLIRDAGFSHVHTFRFSPRPGTKAALMEDSVPEKVKTERSGRVIELSARQKRAYLGRFNDRETLFLSERTRSGVTTGFNEYYAAIEVEGRLPRGEFFTVKTTLASDKQVLTGSLIV